MRVVVLAMKRVSGGTLWAVGGTNAKVAIVLECGSDFGTVCLN